MVKGIVLGLIGISLLVLLMTLRLSFSEKHQAFSYGLFIRILTSFGAFFVLSYGMMRGVIVVSPYIVIT